MYRGLHVKYPLLLSDSDETNFLDRFSKNTQISNFIKMRPDRQADTTKLLFAILPRRLKYFAHLLRTIYSKKIVRHMYGINKFCIRKMNCLQLLIQELIFQSTREKLRGLFFKKSSFLFSEFVLCLLASKCFSSGMMGSKFVYDHSWISIILSSQRHVHRNNLEVRDLLGTKLVHVRPILLYNFCSSRWAQKRKWDIQNES
jgi:hypothetical protein